MRMSGPFVMNDDANQVARRPSLRSESTMKSMIAFSLTGSTTTGADDEVRMSSFFATCLTANILSVGYLFVPWGELQLHWWLLLRRLN
jgi:hypothetical protein